jgi:folylpolyglutamate synthase/dihydropteroate synthase
LSGEQPATVVVGMLADKHVEDFVGELELASADWLTCPTQGARGATASELAERLRPLLQQGCESYPSVEAAMVAARAQTPPGELILVCGSFGVVGPALQWLGLY